jgi:hypothetical protein
LLVRHLRDVDKYLPIEEAMLKLMLDPELAVASTAKEVPTFHPHHITMP